jgi:acetoin utilization deacetylase AcuC-like enzyme
MTTGYVYHPSFLEHDLRGHPENSRRLTAILETLERHGMRERLWAIVAEPISQPRLERTHDGRYIDLVRRIAERGGGNLDLDTYISPGSYKAAVMAAGGLVEATRAVLDGEAQNAFALVRPPGHHALRNRGMGFCLFNNVAVAAQYCLSERGLERVAIVDFDVHHGNGTQEQFEADPSVLYISSHQYPYYPGTGHWDETGKAAGIPHLVNIPLSGAIGDNGFGRIMDEIVARALRQFQPQIILVSAGYDAHWDDPLASMRLSVTGYARIARRLKESAEELCEGRLVFALEGGYHLQALSYSVLNTFGVLLGDPDSAIVDPLGPSPYREHDVEEIVSHARRIHRL